jgi:signal transduction histidine kinase
MMRRTVQLTIGCTALLVVGGCLAQVASLTWFSPELRHYEAERIDMAAALVPLPPVPTPQLTERLGYHSGFSTSSGTVEWVELDLRHEEPLDAVVLIPAASDSGRAIVPGYGFPLRFRVEISDSTEQAGRTVIADETPADFTNPGTLPVYLPCAGKRARFVRITATKLYRDGGRALFALGEIAVLHGKRNIAAGLGRSDFSCSRTMGAQPVWGLSNLVDGHSVLGPPQGSRPSPTLGYSCKPVILARDPHPTPRWVQVDLGEVMPVDEVRLFPAYSPEFAHRPGYGWPTGLTIQLANDESFRNAVELSEAEGVNGVEQRTPVGPGENAISFVAHDETARFVRVTAPQLFNANGRFLFALAEMQVWSGDTNAALGKEVSAFDSIEEKGWSRAALVDGFTSRADILDLGEWLLGLSQRREITQTMAMLDARSTDIRSRFIVIFWWALAAGIVAVLLALLGMNLRSRRDRRLELEALRQRISQDLHDDIGSSLGCIVLISDDALALTKDEAMQRELGEIRDTARQTLDSMRDIVRLAQSERYGDGDLIGHLRDIIDRILRNIPHTLNDPAAVAFNGLRMDQRRDLVLMLKESLHNLVRHSQATQADITLAQADGKLILTVRDNGRGFDPATLTGDGMGLANLRRRAAKHGGAVSVASAPQQGTSLIISLPLHV